MGCFHYVYAMLHHPQYREKYAANLKRELRDSVCGVRKALLGESASFDIPVDSPKQSFGTPAEIFRLFAEAGKSWRICTSITNSSPNTS